MIHTHGSNPITMFSIHISWHALGWKGSIIKQRRLEAWNNISGIPNKTTYSTTCVNSSAVKDPIRPQFYSAELSPTTATLVDFLKFTQLQRQAKLNLMHTILYFLALQRC